MPTTTALTPYGLSLRSTLFLTLGGHNCRFVGLSFVEFPNFNVMSNSFLNSVSLHFNFVLVPSPFEISPCVQGCVLGSARYLKIPTQVHPDLVTMQLLNYKMQRALLTLIVHSHISMRAFRSWPWCLILVRCHPTALLNSYNYATTDTLLLLLSGNLLIATHTSRYLFCFNFECGGVSCSLLNFLGTRNFSV